MLDKPPTKKNKIPSFVFFIFLLFSTFLKMEKARKGLKPVKLPQLLFNSWKAIIDNYVNSCNNVKLIPAVMALQKLIACQEATYDQQARYIKEAGNPKYIYQ